MNPMCLIINMYARTLFNIYIVNNKQLTNQHGREAKKEKGEKNYGF